MQSFEYEPPPGNVALSGCEIAPDSRLVALAQVWRHQDGEVLSDYEETQEGIEFRKALTPAHVIIPRLDEEYQTELERLNLTISEVLDSNDGISSRGKPIGPVLSQLLVRARLRSYQRRIYEQLHDAHNLFSPTSGERP